MRELEEGRSKDNGKSITDSPIKTRERKELSKERLRKHAKKKKTDELLKKENTRTQEVTEKSKARSSEKVLVKVESDEESTEDIDEEILSSFKKRARRDKGRYSKESGIKDLPKEKFSIPILKRRANFICVVCDNNFENSVGLKLHFRHHSGSELWERRVQPKNRTVGYQGMKKVENFMVIVFKCELCSEKCYTIANYRQHLIDKHKNNQEFLEKMCFPCSSCEEIFNIRYQLIQHLRDFHDIFSQCPICNEIIKTEDLFAEHLDETHSDDSNSQATVFGCAEGYFCKICGWAHESYSKVSFHFEKAHSKKTYECDYCDEKCETKMLLNGHVRICHEEMLMSCDICENQFIDMNSLKSHKRMRHKGVEVKKKRVECKICQKSFSSNAVYKAHHVNTHQNKEVQSKLAVVNEKKKAKEKKCPICGKILNSYLITFHKANIHKFGNTEEDVCHLCDKTFKNPSTLYTHNICYHKTQPNKSKEENAEASGLSCPECGKGFLSKASVFSHWRLHTFKRPFKCSMCEATFRHHSGYPAHKKHVHENDQEAQLTTLTDVEEQLKEEFNEALDNKLSEKNVYLYF